jgi:formylmethanofuran dehydrogenase subunit E
VKTLVPLLLSLTASAWAASQPDDAPDWYYPQWLAEAPYAPRFEVRDTVNKYGRYADQAKVITLKDLIKLHGHFCGGLVEGATALRLAFDHLFPGSPIDRTDLRIASNNSACGGDVAAYLTGARARFSSHLIDPGLKESDFVVQRVSTGATVRVVINAATYPKEVRARMKKIESGDHEPADIDRFQELQWDYARRLVSRPASESVDLIEAPDYAWPEPPCRDLGRRKDNDFKDVPPATTQPQTAGPDPS